MIDLLRHSLGISRRGVSLRLKPRQRWAVCLVLLLGAVCSSITQSSTAQEVGVKRSGDETDRRTKAQTTVNRYWLGIRCENPVAADDLLQVMDVIPGAPAATAGIRPHDQILAVDDISVRDVAELQAVVQRSNGQVVRLQVRRAGETLQLPVRPSSQKISDFTVTVPSPRPDELERWIQESTQNQPWVRMRFVYPAIVLDPESRPFPPNTRFVIESDQSGNVRLEIQQAERAWVVTHSDVGRLPHELRPWALRLLQATDVGTSLPIPHPPVAIPEPPTNDLEVLPSDPGTVTTE